MVFDRPTAALLAEALSEKDGNGLEAGTQELLAEIEALPAEEVDSLLAAFDPGQEQ